MRLQIDSTMYINRFWGVYSWRYKSLFLLVAGLICFSQGLSAQVQCTRTDSALLAARLQTLTLHNLDRQDIGYIADQVGKSFLGKPYLARGLETTGGEQLVIVLKGLDCATLVDNVVVLARLARLDQCELDDYERELEWIRYRDGKLIDYASRLHYTSDWISNNEYKGVLEDITASLGGMPYTKQIRFMSNHPQYYAPLADTHILGHIKDIEQQLNSQDRYYIPKEMLAGLESGISPGDIIAITSAKGDLDISHIGLATEVAGRIHLLHASTDTQKVCISDKPLITYLAENKGQTGIMVCRLTDPRDAP